MGVCLLSLHREANLFLEISEVVCYNLFMTKEDKIIIFCDGASKGNPGPGGFGAVIVLPEGKVIELGGHEKHTTNNKMELTGVLKALEKVKARKEEIVIYTDSKYVINGMTGWIYGWQKNNWQTKEKKVVLNKEIWEKLAGASKGKKIKWNYVGGHIGVLGNERCDEIASDLAQNKKVDLYSGSLEKYKINISDLGHDEIKKVDKREKNHHSNAKAYSYLSLVNGILYIDKTWPECEKRVKGKAGVKYKKATSLIEEKEIIRGWGLNE